MSLADDYQRRRFALVIAGLPTVYYSQSSQGLSSVPAIGTNIVAGGPARDFVEAIVGVSDYSAELDPIGGVASYQPITISLGIDRRGGSTDPGVILSRIGPRAEGVEHAFLTEGIDHSATMPQTVGTDRDVSSVYSAGDLAHIGAETFLVSATSATPDISFSARAVGETPIQTHQVSLGGTNAPELTSGICYWRGRRASIWVSPGRADGSWGGWVEYLRGFLDSTPSIEEGLSVSLEVVPITALIDQGLTGEVSRQTTLLHGYHHFEEGRNNITEYALGIHDPALSTLPNLVGNGVRDWNHHGAGVGTVMTSGQHEHAEIFDVTLARADGSLYHEHPRQGSLGFERNDGTMLKFRVFGYRTVAGVNIGYDMDDPRPMTDYHRSDHGYLLPNREIKRYEETGLIAWPSEFIKNFNAAAPSSISGLDGGYVQVRLGEDGGRLQLRLLPFANTRSKYHIWFWSHPAVVRFVDAGLIDFRYWSANGSRPPLGERELMAIPIDWAQPSRSNYPRHYPHDAASRDAELYRRAWQTDEIKLQAYNLRDYGLGFFQPSESRLLITDQLPGIPSVAGANPFHVTVVSYDRRRDDTIRQTIAVTHQTVVVYDGVDVGYQLHVAERQRQDLVEVVDWASRGSDSRTTVALSNQFDSVPAGEILLRLLESGGGGQINGTYDVSAIGLNLPSSAIDEESFLAVSAATRLSDMSFALDGDDVDILDVVEGILKSLGAAIVLRRSGTDNERLKLTLIPVGMEQVSRVQQTIEAGDWIVDPPPSWGVHEASVNQLMISYDYDPVEAKFLGEVTVNNERAIQSYSQERLSMDLDLYGATAESLGQNSADLYSALRPLFTRIFRLASDPVRTWRGSVGFGKGHLLEVGAMVQVSSPHLKSYGDSYGVTDGLGLVRSVRQSLTGEGVDVELLHYGFDARGWNASAEVVAVISVTVLEFASLTYTRGRTPAGDATEDLALFEAGDVIDYLPPGDEDNPTTLTIQSVDLATNRVTFTGAHGVASAVGHIEPTSYNNAPSRHQLRAYLADATGTLGTAADEGGKYL